MAGKVAQSPAAPGAPLTLGDQSTLSASLVNSFRVIAVVDRLALHLQPGRENNSSEFFGLCLSLARGIDYAVANNELPSKVQDLPLLLKQVCRRRNDPLLEAAVMVLMISVKNACKVGWFPGPETQELLSLTNEIGNNFRSAGDINDVSGDSQNAVSTVFSRFYPRMKMGAILASLEVKPGFGAYVLDFHISKKSHHSSHEKIGLFVAETSNLDISTCIVSPQQVNFLVNGRGVDKRTNVQMDTGPQLPTDVTGLLKYGTNLLQAVGTFNGSYIILVAFISTTKLPDPPVLLDYVQSDPTLSDPDSDIIEGPSRISLNCPISFSRIEVPVKGSSCKHLQCFDFGNYVEINSKRPSWRCPHCNQNVSYTDIRIDQNMVKVLKEVGDNITHVNISAGGSWMAVIDGIDNEGQPPERNCQGETPKQPDESPATPMVLDLTEGGDDLMDELLSNCDVEERKPSKTPGGENSDSQMGDWANLIHPSGSGFGSSPQYSNAVSQPSSIDARSQFPHLASDFTSMQHLTAVQALPAQVQTPILHQRPGMTVSRANSGGLTGASNSAPSTTNGFSTASLQRFSRSQHDLPWGSSPGSSLHRQTPVQNVNHQVRSSISGGVAARPTASSMPPPSSHPTARSSSPLSRASTFQGTQSVPQQAPHMRRQPPVVPVQMQSTQLHHSPNPDTLRTPLDRTAAPNSAADLSDEQTWRPAGRMRGSLQGRDLAEIRNLVLQSSQQTPPGGAASNSTLSDATPPPHLRGLFGRK